MNENVSVFVKKFVMFFGGGVALSLLLLVLIWLIPDKLIERNVVVSLEQIDKEGREWAYTFTHSYGCRIDNWTDSVIISTSISEYNGSALEKAMFANGYERYWHGYTVLLRPLLCFFNYWEIRYINMFVFLLLFTYNIILICEKLRKRDAVIFAVVLAIGYCIILPYCIQYSTVFYIALISNIILLKKTRFFENRFWFSIFLLGIGMLTNFLDLLTAPLITMAFPIIILLLLFPERPLENVKSMILGAVSWVIGYAGMWITKWGIASLVLKKNVFSDAMNQAQLRINGDGQENISLKEMFKRNFEAVFPDSFANALIITGIVIVIFFIIFFLFHKQWGKSQKNNFLFLIIAASPIVWLSVLKEHSYVHFIFTYRILLVLFWGIAEFFANSISFEKIIKRRNRICADHDKKQK